MQNLKNSRIRESSSASLIGYKVTSGKIGNGKVKEILMSKRQLVVKSNKIKRVEETVTETLFKFLKSRMDGVSSKEVLGIIEGELRGFDKILMKSVLKQLAIFQNNLWKLRNEFISIVI